MKMHNHFRERMKKITEKEFLNFCFFNVDISLNIYDLYLKLYRCIENIAMEGTMSQIFYICPSSFFFIKFRGKKSKR